jgi:hypothetical protein
MEIPSIETMAEIMCNLAGENPNDSDAWDRAMGEARQIRDDGTWFELHPLDG